MKTMKQKIRFPFLLIVVVIPLITLVVFNIAFRIYIERNTRNELVKTVNVMKTLLKKELVISIYNPEEEALNNAFKNISSALYVSKLAGNSELLLFNSNYELIYPKGKTYDNTEKIKSYLKSDKLNSPKTIRERFSQITLLGFKLTNLPISDSPYIVFISTSTEVNNLIYRVNLILGIVLLTGIIISIFIASHISEKLSKPLREICDTTSKIGGGEFININNSSDIAELSILNESINNMSNMLLSYDKAQKAFLQDASHELRTPLTVIQGYAEGIENGVFGDVKEAAKIIATESIKLNKLVDELLTLSRIENNAYSNELELLNLNDVLKEYFQSLSLTAKKAGKELSLVLPSKDLAVRSNDMLLSRCVNNIVSNCLRYAKASVKIELREEENEAVIIINDDGPGISEKDLPHLFKRFYKGKDGNFGLGLSIVHTAVQYMGGRVNAKNGNIGAEFTIFLPLCKGPKHPKDFGKCPK